MANIDVERLPALVAEGKITAKEGAYLIWEDVYCNPQRYGIALMNEDDRSDFLLFLLRKFERILTEFEPGKALFRTYIRGAIRILAINYIRRRATAATEEAITRHTLKTYVAESTNQYEAEIDCDDDEEELAIFSKTFSRQKKRQMAENTALVLTLKTCHEVDEKIVQNVSRFLHIAPETLTNLVNKLKKQSDYKVVQREHVIRRRDNAFYYHRKYLVELHRLQEGTVNFESVMRKYQKQTENWMRQNKLLSHRYVLSPTNASIAKEIDMEPRKVSFYISRAVRKQNPFTIEEDEENQTEQTEEEK